jgi:type II secretory pathway predicted ATPase ExeA
MFLDFYGLREQPFGVSPDPKYLYFSPSHREALASLFYGIETGRGFLGLIAEPGMGKTSLLFQLVERLKGVVRSAFLFQTQCDSRELLRYLLEALGIGGSAEADLVQLHSRLNHFLLAEAAAGRRVVVFVDEAQNLSDETLETVRLLSNFEACDRKLFQYIRHRLQIAGYEGPEVFTSDSAELIAKASQGIPRNINNICFNAMSLGCATECRRIGPEMVKEALNDLSLNSLVDRSGILRHTTATLSGSPARFSLRWWRDNVFASRTAQTAVLSALLGGLGTYLGAHIATGAINNSSAASLPAPIAAQGSGQSGVTPGNGPTTGTRDSSSTRFVTYVVRPNDTIWNLCVTSLGRYDQAAVAEFRKLNPGLIDVDRIEVGQQIRLPLRASN